jgi:Domain of unknown function (DUF1887)
MTSSSIETILKARGAWLKATHGEPDEAIKNRELSRLIAEKYGLFEKVRDHLIKATEEYVHRVPITAPHLSDEGLELLAVLEQFGMAMREPGGNAICDTKSKRYLSGGWLEELAWLAAIEAGADEALYGQVIGWKVKEFTGENEIDLIVRKGDVLGFMSCKAFRSELDMQDRKHRNRLMDSVHEADNLGDHFGRPGEKVAVLVTTDLFDEDRNVARYNALMGKAAVLDVQIIALEDLSWDKLLAAISTLFEREPE